MAVWYCSVGGNQYGPVSEEELRRWVAQGRVRPYDYVWTEGMTQWATVASLPQFASQAGPPPMGDSMVGAPPLPGTGGQTPNDVITSQAREALRGRWGLPIAFCLLLALLEQGISFVPWVGGLALMILIGALTLGEIVFFLTFVRGGQTQLGMMFHGFQNFGNALGAVLLVGLLVLAWTLLAALPGGIVAIIIGAMANARAGEAAAAIVALLFAVLPAMIASIYAQLTYSQTLYVLADSRSCGIMEAINASKQLMAGHRTKLFCLGLRYFAWALLCVLTLGIGFLWLGPYMQAGYARFYDDLKLPAAPLAAPAIQAPEAPLNPPAML